MSGYYALEDTIGTSLIYSLTQLGFSSLLSIAVYVLTALSLYTIAKRRGLNHPWLAWIPVANVWLIGSISDQYRYVTQRQNKSKRKWLLGLNIATAVLSLVIIILAVGTIIQAFASSYYYYDEEEILSTVLRLGISMLALVVPLLAVSVAAKILRYMAMYDIYKSLDPANCTLYLVLSILFSVTEPFFLIFNRNKDLGMPPRRPEPNPYVPPAPEYHQPPEFL